MVWSNNQKKYPIKLITHLLYLGVILVGIFFAYFGLQNSYFVQDEWHSFGNYNFLLSLRGSDFLGNLLVSDFPFHFAPLSLIFKMSLYKVFGLNAAPYFIASLLIHFLVSVVIYILILQLTKRKLAALIGALFFALNSSHYETITWIGTFEGVEFSVLFGLLSLFSYLVYLQKRRFHFLVLTFTLSLIGLLFKETALTFLLLLGLMIIFNKNRLQKITGIISVVLVLILYASLRFTYLLFGVQAIPISGMQERDNSFLMLAYNFLSSSVKIFPQVFFPNEFLVYITNVTSSPFNIYQHFARGPWIIENGFRYDSLTLPLGILMMVFMWWISRKTRDKFSSHLKKNDSVLLSSDYKQSLFLGVGIAILTVLPLLALDKYLTYLDSRYLYPATVGVSLIVGLIVTMVISSKRKMIKGLGLFTLIVVLSMHIFSLKVTIGELVNEGQMRKAIISRIVSLYPVLPAKTIFYTESNSAFYGTAEDEKIMPFQSGFGQLLLIQYYPTEHFDTGFFRNDYLWNITDQGYQELGEKGFGYYRDFNLMAESIKSKKLPLGGVIAFDYDSKSGALVDTTKQTQQRLIGFISNKEEINQQDWTVSVSSNEKDAKLALDNNELTFWDSNKLISSPQNFLIDFHNFHTIASIQIKSGSSKDQNKNGYQILASDDNQNWQEVFYEKLYAPKDGIVNIYFAPQKARFLNIRQIGGHPYATWVINEIKVYAVVN